MGEKLKITKKINNKHIIYTITWLVAFAALLVYLLQAPQSLQILIQAPLSLLLGLIFLVFVTWFTVYLQSYATLATIGKPPPFFEYMAVFFVGLLINYTPLRIGIAARAYYLYKRHSVDVAVFSALSAFRLMLMIFSSGLIAASAMIILAGDLYTSHVLFLSFFIGCAFAPVVLFLSVRLNLWRIFPNNIAEWINNFGRSFAQVNNKNGIVALLVLLISLQFLFVSTRMYLCFDYAGIEIGMLALMVLAPLGSILSVLAITPGGIGVREFVVASACVVLGFSFEQAMQALIIDRVAMIVVAIVLGLGELPFASFITLTSKDETQEH